MRTKSAAAAFVASALVAIALAGSGFAQPAGNSEGVPIAAPSESDDAGTPAEEVTAPQSNATKETYVKALDGLTDDQVQMVPVVLATIGELACDGLQVDHKKAASFVSSRAADDSAPSRKEAAATAKQTATVLLAPWLSYVQQDPGPFCEKAYALHDTGKDLWKR